MMCAKDGQTSLTVDQVVKENGLPMAMTHRSFVTTWCAVRHGPTGFYHRAVGLTCRFRRTRPFLACQHIERPLDWRCVQSKSWSPWSSYLILKSSLIKMPGLQQRTNKTPNGFATLGSPAQPHRPPPQSYSNRMNA